jgi:Spy/CpxP family protein refolding chaperone
MAVHGAKLVAELKGILTPEQKEALEEHRAARHEKRKGRMENRPSFLDDWIETHSKEPQ